MSDKKKLIEKLGEKFGVEPSRLLATLKATAFKQKNGQQITNEQMMQLLVVADQYGLNPFTKELYAYPDRNGIIPVVGVDGWARIINSNSEFDGMEFQPSDEMIEMEGAKAAPTAMTCVIYRKDRNHSVAVTEYLDEVYRPPFRTKQGALIKGPWQTHTKRLLRHKAMIQACRLAFGLVGIYDQDEAERIVEAEAVREDTDWDRKYGGVTVATVDGKAVQQQEEAKKPNPEVTHEPVASGALAQTEKPPVQQAKQDDAVETRPSNISEEVWNFAKAVVARVQQTGSWEAGRNLAEERLFGVDRDYVLARIEAAEQAAKQTAESDKEAA